MFGMLLSVAQGRKRASVPAVGSLIISGCGKGAGIAAALVVAAIVLATVAAPVTVPLTVFPGGDVVKPALLLPFSGEINAAAVTPDGNKLYAADSLHNTVSVIDVSTRRVTKVMDVATGPRFVAITPDGSKVLVSNFGSRDLDGNTLTIIDSASDEVVETLSVGAQPFAIAITPDNNKALVVNAVDDSVSVIDLKTNSIINTLDAAQGFTGVNPVAIVMSSDGAQAFVANRSSSDVTVIDVNNEQVTNTVVVGAAPTGLALLPDDSKLYVSNRDSDSISIIDVSSGLVEATLLVSAGPMALAANPNGEHVYIAHGFSGNEDDICGIEGSTAQNSISVIDVGNAAVLPGTITVGDAPLAVAVVETDANTKLYSVSACSDLSGKGTASSLNTAAISDNANLAADSIVTVARGTGLVLSPTRPEIYVTHPHAISVLDVENDTLLGSPISVRGAGPTKLALTADGTKLYGIQPGRDSVAVIDVDPARNDGQFLSALTVGSRPSDLAITNKVANNQVVVSNAGFSRTPDTRISVIDVTGPGSVDDAVDHIELTDQSISPATTGRGPIDVAISSDNNHVFVANFGDFFSNDREPGLFLSRVDLATFQVTNFDNYGEWLVAVNVDPQATLDGTTGVVNPANAGDDVVYTAAFLDDEITRGKISNPAVAFSLFASIERPIGLVFANSRAIVANYRTNNVAGTDVTRVVEIDLDGSSDSIQIEGVNPAKIAVTPDEGVTFVLHGGDRSFLCGPADDVFCEIGNTVSAIELPFSNVVSPTTASLSVGQRPTDIAFTPDLAGVPKRAYVTNYFDDTVSVIEPWTLNGATPAVVATLDVGKGPSGVVVNEQGTRAYVANSISNSVSVISIDNASAGTVVGTIDLDP